MDLSHLLIELKRRFNVSLFGSKDDTLKLKGSPDSFWVDTFHQVYVEGSSKDRDDLLFIVKWDSAKNSECVDVYRRDASSLPSPRDESILWERTFYLNLILHEFEYHVTCGVITVQSGVVQNVSKRVELQVYPSPSQRRMDKKDSPSDVIYPDIMFCVDNFEDVFSEMHCDVPGEKIAVQLVASSKSVPVKQLVFLGAIDYAALKQAFDNKDHKETGLGARLKKLSIRTRNSRVFDVSTPFHFIKMRGPHLKGFAEVAVWKQDLPLAKKLSTTNSSFNPHFYGECRQSSANNEAWVDGTQTTTTDAGSTLSTTPQKHEGGFSRFRSLWTASKRSEADEQHQSSSASTARMYAYLTYLKLPWYDLVEDILNCTKEGAL